MPADTCWGSWCDKSESPEAWLELPTISQVTTLTTLWSHKVCRLGLWGRHSFSSPFPPNHINSVVVAMHYPRVQISLFCRWENIYSSPYIYLKSYIINLLTVSLLMYTVLKIRTDINQLEHHWNFAPLSKNNSLICCLSESRSKVIFCLKHLYIIYIDFCQKELKPTMSPKDYLFESTAHPIL